MSKKDFELIASALKAAHKRMKEIDTESTPITVQEAIRIVVSKVATALGTQIVRFDRDKFVVACYEE